jgi:hypothetical protein
MRYFAVSLIALAAALWWNQHRTNGYERMLGRIASEIAGRPVAVNCQGLPSALVDISPRAGEVMFNEDGTPPDETTLKRDTCRYLERFENARSAPSFACVRRVERCEPSIGKIAASIRVLAHEAWHLRGVTNEAQTECYALQTTALVARRLGATPEQAQAVAAWNTRHVYPYLPSQYQSGECRDGGGFDLRRDSTEWP